MFLLKQLNQMRRKPRFRLCSSHQVWLLLCDSHQPHLVRVTDPHQLCDSHQMGLKTPNNFLGLFKLNICSQQSHSVIYNLGIFSEDFKAVYVKHVYCKKQLCFSVIG
ncbi:hypothetical protein ILYODFUR_030748 [Ilyodon furcidens]|uniref:Uncharacterized protein n=1 Tax=Ilyodon furcidens TaxID=33524 RepID=A0ABV0TDV3_9TELE